MIFPWFMYELAFSPHFFRIISHLSSKTKLFDFNLTKKSEEKKNCKTGPIKKALEPIFDPFVVSFFLRLVIKKIK